MKKTAFAILFLLPFVGYSLPIDSLRHKIENEKNIRQKLEYIADFIYDIKRTYPDSAIALGEYGIRLAAHDSLLHQKTRIITNLGVIYLDKGDYTKADSLFDRALKMAYQAGEMRLVAMILNNYGLSQSNQHKYEKAIELYLRSAHISDSLGIIETTVRTMVNVGIIYHLQNNVRKALDYHLSALEKIDRHNLDLGIMNAVVLRNAGAFYHLLGINDSAYFYTNRSLEISHKYNDKRGLAICYHNLGDFVIEKEPRKAEQFYLKSLAIKQEMNNIPGMAITSGGLAKVYHRLNQPDKALHYSRLTIEYSLKIGEISYLMEIYKLMSTIYEEKGELSEALRYYKIHADYRDSLAKRTSESKLLELQTQFETSLKEKQIAELKHEQEINELKLNSTRRILRLTLVGTSIIGLLLIFVFWSMISIRRQRNALKEKNAIIEQQNEEIRVQRDYLAESNQKIQHQNRQIQDSINYAYQIQSSLLPPAEIMADLLGEYSLFFKPKDVVSGDFFWLHSTDRYVFLAVGDCTGHGVPGAFMSVLSISLLNEIVKGKKMNNPADILNEMRRLVILSLKQNAHQMGGTDGLEMAFCRIDRKQGKITYAGANRPMALVRDKQLQEYLPDKMPLSMHVTMKEFTETTIETSAGDLVYLYSDGFEDQIGGTNGQRYGKHRFKELLVALSSSPLSEQSGLFKASFNEWKSDHEQIDDVVVVGFRPIIEGSFLNL